MVYRIRTKEPRIKNENRRIKNVVTIRRGEKCTKCKTFEYNIKIRHFIKLLKMCRTIFFSIDVRTNVGIQVDFSCF